MRTEHSASPINVQYHLADDANDYHRNQGRSDRRKVFRIKNPFQRNIESNERQEDESNGSEDNNAGASNQYPSMQYSLPPEDFLQKMRAENPYLQQYSTPSPMLSYTATPQSQYQFPTNPSNNFDSNQQANQINQMESKSQSQPFQSNPNQYQYSGGYPYDNNVQSTPSPAPSYLSTPNNQQYVSTPNNPFITTQNTQYVSSQSSQYLATQPSTYVSSSSPVFLSSQPNLQQYVSSPVSVIQTGSPDYSNRVGTASSNSLNYDQNEQNKRIRIDHYDNSANGIRYPIQQYSNEYPSSTIAPPTSTPYPENVQDAWQNAINSGVSSLSKSLQELSLSQYQNSPYNGPTPDGRSDSGPQESLSSETHRIGNIPAANNLYLDYVQPDFTSYNMRSRTKDLEHEVSQPGGYSNGDFGWKLKDKKPLYANDGYQSASSQTRYQTFGYHPDGSAMSQMNFYLDNSKAPSHNYEQISKSATESIEAQEFAKAAAKAQESMKQRQQLQKLSESYFGHNYAPTFSTSNPVASVQQQPNVVSTFYGNSDNRPRTQYLADSSNANPLLYGHQQHQQQDLITAPPNYYFANPKDLNAVEGKPKQPFDHAKALKNIVPIDVSNVIGSDGPPKTATDNNGNRYNIPNVSKEQIEQNLKQYYKPLTDAYYKDKNSGYGYNIKAKPDDGTSNESIKQMEQNIPYYIKQQAQESAYSQSSNDNKRYGETSAPQMNYLSNNYPTSVQQQINAQSSIQRQQNQMQSEINSILKLNDIPYRLTQGLTSEQLRLHNSNFDQNGIPTPIPTRINQNVGSHQLDVANSILSKLIQGKQQGLNSNRPDIDLPSGGALSTINGFRVANPFNVDLKLVAEMLKGKTASDDTHLLQFREQFNKPSLPHKLDMSSLQQLLLKNDNINYGSLSSLNDGLSAIGSPYMEIYNSGRYPYQGVKYSRSQEEEEPLVPIADASNTHPIGAVIESEEVADAREVNEGVELGETDGIAKVLENHPKKSFAREHKGSERHKHPNSITPSRPSYLRKYPKSDVAEPYPLLKPPPQRPSRSRSSYNTLEKRGRRRRVNRPKFGRMMRTEPLFASESKHVDDATPVPTLLRPPAPVSEDNSDVGEQNNS